MRLSLVSIPVEIHSAIEPGSGISLNQIHKPSGKRVNYTKTVKGVGPIDAADIVKGYEIDKDIYVTLEPQDRLPEKCGRNARWISSSSSAVESIRAISRSRFTSCRRTNMPPKDIW